MPIVYNPYLALPFLLAPMACGTLGYFAISSGFMNPIIALIPWPSPMGLGAFIGTGGDYRAMFVAILSAILALIIYLPFVKIYDNKLYKEEQAKSENQEQLA